MKIKILKIEPGKKPEIKEIEDGLKSLQDEVQGDILHRMDLMGICISTGSACDSVNTQVSHVIKAIGVPEEYAQGTIRISLGKNNTMEECKLIAEALIKIIRK